MTGLVVLSRDLQPPRNEFDIAARGPDAARRTLHAITVIPGCSRRRSRMVQARNPETFCAEHLGIPGSHAAGAAHAPE
jgi:hypothetical protein